MIDMTRIPEGERQCLEQLITNELNTAVSRHKKPSKPPPGNS